MSVLSQNEPLAPPRFGRIPVAGPSITQREIDYVTDAVANAWYADANVYHERFEKAVADYLGVKHAIALPSCTSGIHLALAALEIGPGDEVVVPEITWIASAAPTAYVGATPVFADIDPRTWCLSAESLRQAITERTKAVVVVDLYGNLPDVDAIRAVADEHGLAVIEDAAQAFGAEHRGRKAGSFGDVGVFSFHGSKMLTTGEGGMLVTNDSRLYERALFLRDHGRQPGDFSYWNTTVAYKYKMSNLQAALGLAQVERVEELVAIKRRMFGWYREGLAGVQGLTLNYEAPEVRNTYWLVTAMLDPALGLDKERLMELLRSRNIECRPFFFPLSSLPAYAETPAAIQARRRNEVAYRLSPYGVNLPSAFALGPSEVAYVCEVLAGLLDQADAAPIRA